MKVSRLTDVEPRPRRVAVGTFDGVHLGHREVIRDADTVLTFDPHPTTVVHPAAVPKLITTLERKAELVGSIGGEELVVIPFDREFAARSAESFIDDVLVGGLGATHVSVGENFRFGNRAKGTPEMLGEDPRFETRVVPLLEADGEIVSSSHIRGLLLGGALAYANSLLVDPFVMSGEVVHGDKRGRELGFPTANLVPDDEYVTPGHGVYACVVNGEHLAAVNVGVRPMFETGRGELIEAYLLDWSGDLYGAEITLAFHHRLRGERRFDSVEALVEQMHRDVAETRRLLAEAV
ncbi:MAG: bifunctional riboflavin kinase/FAD synthetase [Solirubrobacteraceae bacterium]|nr:bifunctional riboflavin kinase/FAD synthetase [Solirubrobacteraceae bacterium]